MAFKAANNMINQIKPLFTASGAFETFNAKIAVKRLLKAKAIAVLMMVRLRNSIVTFSQKISKLC
jgi:hypothetical protein